MRKLTVVTVPVSLRMMALSKTVSFMSCKNKYYFYPYQNFSFLNFSLFCHFSFSHFCRMFKINCFLWSYCEHVQMYEYNKMDNVSHCLSFVLDVVLNIVGRILIDYGNLVCRQN